MDLLSSDFELLNAFRRGDESAMALVYHSYVDIVWTTVRRAGIIEPDLQADVVQETFLKAFLPGTRAAYDSSREFKPYICGIARNLAVDMARRAGTKAKMEHNLLKENGIDHSNLKEEPEDLVHHHRLKELVNSYIDSVSPELKRFWMLRYKEELPQADVAAHMGITRRRVRTLERRLHKGLKRFLFSKGVHYLEKL
ncbi:MAG: sigma-70 family RNA polymerase sigma factor [Deltaproteobacteria bacterium]|nr:sigma-70 family RNA polymerase sigma factor [Deltaproteobacteria bacterium]